MACFRVEITWKEAELMGLDAPEVQSAPLDAPVRPVRADAKRNHDQLLAVASQHFQEQGVEVALEQIARSAGVGIGTLYRHFPTRAALIEAVYRREVELLCARAGELSATLPPDEALTAWMLEFIKYVALKRGMATALKEAAGSGELFSRSRALMAEAAGTLLDAAAKAGRVRADVEAMDLLRALGGICMVNDDPGWQDRAVRLVNLLMDGLRFGAPVGGDPK